MKTTYKIYRQGRSRSIALAMGLACGLASTATLKAQDIFVANEFNGTIGEYGMNGSPVNASLISGLNDPIGIAIAGNDLFVANDKSGTIGEYTLSGQTVNASLISGLGNPGSIAVSGNDLFVANFGVGTIGEYGLDGSTVNASLVSGLSSPQGIAVSGSDLFVLNYNSVNGSVGEYTTSGQTVNASLISGISGLGAGSIAVSGTNLFVAKSNYGSIGVYSTSGVSNSLFSTASGNPLGIAVSGNDLFVSEVSGIVGEYTTSGATVNASLISGSVGIDGIAISPAPEPSTVALAGLGAVALIARGATTVRRSRKQGRGSKMDLTE